MIIQVSSHFGGRRQEAQRLGRILRPKQNQETGTFNAFFYTLISTDTREMYYSAKRQQYLVDQGYTFKVIQDLVDIADAESTLLRTKEQECDLLAKVLRTSTEKNDAAEEKAIRQNVSEDYDNLNNISEGQSGVASEPARGSVLMVGSRPGKGIVQNLSRPGAHVVLGGNASGGRGRGRVAGVKRKVSSLGGISGVDGATYEEFDSSRR